jgi:carbon-monoxide dehydrogenase medium subunit
MIPAQFEYRRAATAEEAVRLLSELGDDAKVLAGGHSLVPLMKLRLARPEVLVDISRLPDLSYVRGDDGDIAIGALTRHHDLARSDLLARELPLMAAAAGQIGDPQIRHRGTIGGSIAHGDPASDLAGVVLALDGTLVLQGPDGRRRVAGRQFFTGFMETVMAPNELLVEIRVPRPTATGWSFQKFNRRAHDWAIVGVAAVALGDGKAGVALINMAQTPVRAAGTEEALAGGASAADAAEHASDGIEPRVDINASRQFRRHLATVLVRRALEEAGV